MQQTLTVPAHGSVVFPFQSPHPFAQCVSIGVGAPAGAELSVASITVAGVEQLLGEGLPASFLAGSPLQLDRQRASDWLCVVIQNDGEHEIATEVTIEFVPVEAMTLRKQTLH